MITSKERIIQTIKGLKPDRIPVCPCGYKGWFEKAGSEWQKKLISETDIMLITENTNDIVILLGENYKEVYEVKFKDNFKIENVKTPKKNLRRITKIEGDTEWTVEQLLKDEEDINNFLSIPFKPFSDLNIDEYKYFEKIIGNNGIVLNRISDAASIPYDLLSPENYYISLIDNEILIYKFTEKVALRVYSYLEKLISKGVNKFVIAGSERLGGGLTNPKYFNDLVFKYDKELVRLVHHSDGIAQIHIHGKVKNYLEKIIDMGFDCIEPIEQPPGGDIFLKEARKVAGNRICIFGNMDDLQFLNSATEKEIIIRTLQSILEAGTNGHYILGGTSSSLFTEQTARAFLIISRVAREYGNYPISIEKIKKVQRKLGL